MTRKTTKREIEARLRKISRDKKGVSSLFIAIYVVLVALLLISTIFVGLAVTKSGLTEYLKVEQARLQENIRLTSLTVDETDPNVPYVVSVIVNNTGAIPVRIRSLYVDKGFICDPSTFPSDAYIAPKEALTIALVANDIVVIWNDPAMNGKWTVATERGTKSTEKGMDLWMGHEDNPIFTGKFYFGPLMILFDEFRWRSGSGQWQSGWTIPKGTDEVTWRIFLTNVDNRAIDLKEDSCFTLVGNDNIPHSILAWYIDPLFSTSLRLEPGGWYYIYYTWSKPFSAGGASTQSINKFSEDITCKNFLTFTGSFDNGPENATPFGQTVPFEAVLITPGQDSIQNMTLSADPFTILTTGGSSSTITVEINDPNQKPIANANVALTTSLGSLSSTSVTTNNQGKASVTLTSSAAGYAIVRATWGNESTSIVVVIKKPNLTIAANPTSIKTLGSSTITVNVTDTTGNPIRNAQVNFSATLGSLSSSTATTNTKGIATVTFTAGANPGKATITANCGGTTRSTTVTITQT